MFYKALSKDLFILSVTPMVVANILVYCRSASSNPLHCWVAVGLGVILLLCVLRFPRLRTMPFPKHRKIFAAASAAALLNLATLFAFMAGHFPSNRFDFMIEQVGALTTFAMAIAPIFWTRKSA